MSRGLVLKENLVFMVSAEDGDIPKTNTEGWGLYYKDTRYLSLLEVELNGVRPALLTSSGEFNFMGNIQSANPHMQALNPLTGEQVSLLPRTLSVRRNRFIEDGMHERFGLFNYNAFPIEISLRFEFGSDFRDMFDVRGWHRNKHGNIRPAAWDGERLVFSYLGLDDRERKTEIAFDVAPDEVKVFASAGLNVERREMLPDTSRSTVGMTVQPATAEVYFKIRLEPNMPFAITYHIVPQGLGNGSAVHSSAFDMGARRMRQAYEGWFKECTGIASDNEVFDKFLQRSIYDLRILTEELPTGLFPVAGIPWFAVPFGRDALITALQTLVFDPQLAIGTLRFLAQYQGKETNDWNEEEPGKILHELRAGEMSVLREMPHVPYYGSVDSTPLFILLFTEAVRWLNSRELYRELLPAVKAGLHWIDTFGDKDGDGFIEYECHNPRGVKNQGWKDSITALQFRDGTIPDAPIALSEPQGYVYAAKIGLADVAAYFGDTAWAEELKQQATTLRTNFNQKFWMPDEGFYALALDSHKNQVPTISSNAGHCLWTGIVDDNRAAVVANRLMAEDMSSGWGVRTISSNEPSYNPMSYHNGSIWAHDNSIVAAGLKRYGFSREANEIISQIFAASQRFRYFRLPELYCGFQQDNRYYSSPAEYPVSCSPQAWTAGAAIFFVQIILGLQGDGRTQRLTLKPDFPAWLNELTLTGMQLGNYKVSFTVRREAVNNRHYQLLVREGGSQFDIRLLT